MWLLAAYRRTHSPGHLAWSEGKQLLGAISYSSYKPGALAVALSYDDSTVNIIMVIIIARDSIYAKRAYAIPIPSVCPSVTRVIHAETVEDRILQFSPYSSPIPLVFAAVSFVQKFERVHPER